MGLNQYAQLKNPPQSPFRKGGEPCLDNSVSSINKQPDELDFPGIQPTAGLRYRSEAWRMPGGNDSGYIFY